MSRADVIRLRILGRLSLAYADDPTPIKLSTRKAGTILAYLAMSPGQTATREQLAALLWGDYSDQQARQSLRQSLVRLRKELGSPDYLSADGAVVRLQPGLWQVDALDFEHLSKSADADDLARAATLFDGEFLSGLNLEEEGFGDWVREQRQRTQLTALRLCETFAARPELVRNGEHPIAATERLLALDPLREDWQRIALTLYARYRGRNVALAQADAFANLLQRELAVKPEQETRHLVERIRAGEIAPARHLDPREPVSSGDPNPVRFDHIVAHDGDVGLPVSPQAKQGRRFPIRALAATVVATALLGAGLLSANWLPRNAPAPTNVPSPAAAAAADYLRDPSQAVAGAPKEREESRLHDGLRLALAPKADPWRSPPLPSDRRKDAALAMPITAVAILPFASYGDNGGSLQSTADIITDDLTNSLSRVAMLRVVSRQTMRSYAGEKRDVAAIGAELGVRYVLEGNVHAHADKLRVNVELIDPATRLPVWSTRIERDRADQDEVRDEIVGRLARELHFEIYHAEGEERSKNPTFKQLIYAGWAAILDHGTRGMPALRRAEQAFTQADVLVPGNAQSRAGLAAFHTLIGSLQLVPDWRAELTKAEELGRQSIRENKASASQYFYLSIVQRMRGGLQAALDLLERCIEITPSHAPCHAHIGHTLVQMNRAEDGIGHINYALRLGPRDQSRPHWLRFAGEAEIEMGHFDGALSTLRQSYDANPRQPYLLRSLAAVHALAGNLDEARKVLAELKTVAPHFSIENYLNRPAPMSAAQPELQRGLRLVLGRAADSRQVPQGGATAMRMDLSPREAPVEHP